MRKAIAIYNAPEGDNKVVEMGGVTFFDGQSVDLNTSDHAHLIAKLPGNQHFEIEIGEEEEPKRKPGRPSNAEKAEAQLKASLTPEQQQASQLSQQQVGQANNALSVT